MKKIHGGHRGPLRVRLLAMSAKNTAPAAIMDPSRASGIHPGIPNGGYLIPKYQASVVPTSNSAVGYKKVQNTNVDRHRRSRGVMKKPERTPYTIAIPMV